MLLYIEKPITACTSLSAGGWGRGLRLNLQLNFQKGGGGLTGRQLLQGVAGKEGGGGELFQEEGGCDFHIKNKLKSETFNDKQS